MARTNRYWSKEDKLKIINKVLIDGMSTTTDQVMH